MDLKDYLRAHQISIIRVKDIPNITFVEDLEQPESRIISCYMEINIDEIEDNFPVAGNVDNFDVSNFLKYINLNKNDVLATNRDTNFLSLMFKGGKFLPFQEYYLSVDAIYIIVAYLKKIKKEHPELKIPILTCAVYDFKLSKEDRIFQEYLDILKALNGMGFRGNLFIDIDKKVSCIFKVSYVNNEGIAISKVIEKSDKREIEKEVGELKKLKEINNYKNKDYLKFEFNNNNEIVFFKDQEQVDISAVYSECLIEAREKYMSSLKVLHKIFIDNKSVIEKYANYINRINTINKRIDNYDNLINSFGGRIKLLKGKFSSRKDDVFLSLFKSDFTNIEENINKFDKIITDYMNNELTQNNLVIITDMNNDILAFIDYFERYCDSINNNIKQTEDYLKDLEMYQEQVENQTVFNVLINPIKFERNHLVSNYSIKTEPIKEDDDKSEGKDSFIKLQIKQSEILSKEDKTILMVYKSLLYRPINHIIKTKRINGTITEEEIDSIIKTSYDELLMRKLDNKTLESENGNYHPDIGVLDNNGDIVSYEQFKKIILDSIPSLEKTLCSVITEEPMIVYRGLSTDDINKKEIGFLSTTIDSNIALSFLDSVTRRDKGKSVLYKINLSKGSPVAFFSTEIFTGMLDEKNANAFGDGQKEVLIDADNYDFEILSVKKINDAYIKREDKTIYLVEINAKPKTKSNHYKEIKTL